MRIIGPSGGNLVPGWGPAYLGVTLTDAEGYESDEAVIRIALKQPIGAFPPAGTKYQIFAGWSILPSVVAALGDFEAATHFLGEYTVQRLEPGGNPDDGDELAIVCRAADFIDKMKTSKQKHYDEAGGFGVAGKIFDDLAAEGGVSAVVHPSIASIKIPHRLRWGESAIEFASALADDLGAIVKPQAGKLTVRPRGTGQSATGQAMAGLTFRHDPSYDWSFQLEPRPIQKEVDGPWFDPAAGTTKNEKATRATDGGKLAIIHPYPTKDEANVGANARVQAQNRSSASGSIEIAGAPEVWAGMSAKCEGFGPDIAAIDWIVSQRVHEIEPAADGWITAVELERKETA